jgi:lipopolysaccharide/colanic/teichoic acid biosynthesis glycosyltransferase
LSSTPLIQTARESAQASGLDLAERAAGLLLLVVASPVLAISAIAVALFSRRSPLVAHLRVSRDGASFWMLKLRTMWDPNQPASAPAGWIEHIIAEPETDAKDPSDARVTSGFAAFCRRHSIDELPQLWHVVRGEMSIVGPRPLTRAEIQRHYGQHAAELLSVKPGLTGLWQVGGRSAIPFPERSALDLELVRSLQPRTYLAILARTLPALITGKGAW